MTSFIRYSFSGIDAERPTPGNAAVLDSGDDWWGGVARNFAAVGIAGLLATNALAAQLPVAAGYQQDELPVAAPVALDEGFWLSPVFTAQSGMVLPFAADDDAPSLRGQPDEDFWVNHVAPVPATLAYPQPWVGDTQDPAGSLYGAAEETYWQNPTAPVALTFARLDQWTLDVQEPAGNFFGQYDEDFWTSGVAPVPAGFAVPSQWSYEQNEQAALLYGVPEESEWQNPAAAAQLAPRPALPFTAGDDLPVATISVDDSDGWVAPRPAVSVRVAPFLADDDLLPVVLTVDEDPWWPFVMRTDSRRWIIFAPWDLDDAAMPSTITPGALSAAVRTTPQLSGEARTAARLTGTADTAPRLTGSVKLYPI